MNYPGMYLKIKPKTPGEQQLDDFFWPADCVNAPPDYFRECIALLRTVKNRDAEIAARLRGYLDFATDTAVRQEIEAFIDSLEKKQSAQRKKAERKNGPKR
jgi:hypothetical protein